MDSHGREPTLVPARWFDGRSSQARPVLVGLRPAPGGPSLVVHRLDQPGAAPAESRSTSRISRRGLPGSGSRAVEPGQRRSAHSRSASAPPSRASASSRSRSAGSAAGASSPRSSALT